MCIHENAIVTVRHAVDRSFNMAGEEVGAALIPDGRVTWYCPGCEVRGNSRLDDPGLPRWLAERIPALPLVK